MRNSVNINDFKNIRGVIFDLDGTLIQSNINFLEMKKRIINYLTSIGHSYSDITTNKLVPEIIEFINNNIKDQELIKKILGKINEIMNEIELQSLRNTTLLEGTTEVLTTLHKRGIKIGVLTRSCRHYTLQSLEKTRLLNVIDYIIARDDHPQPKPNPTPALLLAKKMKLSPQKILLVGDHVLDALCAEKAGMKFIGVLTGSYTACDFKKLNVPFILSVNDLLPLIS